MLFCHESIIWAQKVILTRFHHLPKNVSHLPIVSGCLEWHPNLLRMSGTPLDTVYVIRNHFEVLWKIHQKSWFLIFFVMTTVLTKVLKWCYFWLNDALNLLLEAINIFKHENISGNIFRTLYLPSKSTIGFIDMYKNLLQSK